MSDDLQLEICDGNEVRGVVVYTYFSSPTFSAGRLRLKNGGETRFAGPVYLAVGEAIVARGKWIEHEKFGEQFQIEDVQPDADLDARGLAMWLSVHPAAIGIGAVRAQRIAEQFGKDFDRALQEQPEAIAQVAGVPVANIVRLAKSWAARAGYNAVATQLAAVGLTKYQIEELIESCGSTVVHALRDNPYSVLGEVPGFGFKKIDDIARNKYGILKDDPRRIDAAIIHCLKEAFEEGSTCLARPDLCDAAGKALFLDNLDAEDHVCDRIDALAVANVLQLIESGPGYYALPWIYKQEAFVASFLEAGKQLNPVMAPEFDIEPPNIRQFIEHLDESQREAAIIALTHRITIMSGGAGCGKTTTIKALCNVYKAVGKEVALCAPTGKAARRMAQVTGMPAQTIHRLLEYSPLAGDFTRNEENPIDANVVIIDEASMFDIQLAYNLFRAIGPRTAVVLVGDHNQLPPVGPGALLRDCIRNELVPVKILSHCHRQAGDLKKNCSSILDGEIIYQSNCKQTEVANPWYVDARHSSESTETLLQVVERLWLELIPKWGYDRLLGTQFLSGMHRGAVGTKNVNLILQRLHQKSLGVTVAEPKEDEQPALYVGDKVICNTNNYSLDIFNGMQGIVMSTRPLVVDFEGRHVAIPAEVKETISLAYCLTPHKCQGSEWDCIVVICHKEQWIMHSRNWLYTAATRARKTCVIVGDRWSIEESARRVKPNQRQTVLSLS